LRIDLEEVRTVVEKSRKVIRERNVSLPSITLASLLGSLYELGILTQGTVAVMAQYFTPRVCAYMLEKGIVKEGNNVVENLNNVLKAYNFEDDEFSITLINGEVRVKVSSKKCKVCPKGVGGAEIKGSACPIPYFIALCLSLLTNNVWKPALQRRDGGRAAVNKVDDNCEMTLRVA
jgi:hypothetical protein